MNQNAKYFVAGICCMGLLATNVFMYQSGVSDGRFVGMAQGFKAGYDLKKSKIVIVHPPCQEGVSPTTSEQDSVLWRI
jgi:hypothetical protein